MGGPPRSGGAPVHLHTLHIPKATTAHTILIAFNRYLTCTLDLHQGKVVAAVISALEAVLCPVV